MSKCWTGKNFSSTYVSSIFFNETKKIKKYFCVRDFFSAKIVRSVSDGGNEIRINFILTNKKMLYRHCSLVDVSIEKSSDTALQFA